MKEIVIKLEDYLYERISRVEDADVEYYYMCQLDRANMYKAIRNGKVLPKHGELITKGQAVALVQFYQQNPQHFSFENLIDDIDKEVPVIEGDTE